MLKGNFDLQKEAELQQRRFTLFLLSRAHISIDVFPTFSSKRVKLCITVYGLASFVAMQMQRKKSSLVLSLKHFFSAYAIFLIV